MIGELVSRYLSGYKAAIVPRFDAALKRCSTRFRACPTRFRAVSPAPLLYSSRATPLASRCFTSLTLLHLSTALPRTTQSGNCSTRELFNVAEALQAFRDLLPGFGCSALAGREAFYFFLDGV